MSDLNLLKNIIKEMCSNSDNHSSSKIKNSTDLIMDLGFDSLEFVTLILKIEEEYNIKLPEEVYLFDNIHTVSNLMKYINKEKNKENN